VSLCDDALPLQIFEYKSGKHITKNELLESATLMGDIHLVNPKCIGLLGLKIKDNSHYQNLFEKCKKWSYSKLLKNIYSKLDLIIMNEE